MFDPDSHSESCVDCGITMYGYDIDFLLAITPDHRTWVCIECYRKREENGEDLKDYNIEEPSEISEETKELRRQTQLRFDEEERRRAEEDPDYIPF